MADEEKKWRPDEEEQEDEDDFEESVSAGLAIKLAGRGRINATSRITDLKKMPSYSPSISANPC